MGRSTGETVRPSVHAVPKIPKAPAEPIHVQLDWGNPVHKDLWEHHIRLSFALGTVDMFAEKGDPLSIMASMGMDRVARALHQHCWACTYELFPEFKGQDVMFNSSTGCYTNRDDDDTQGMSSTTLKKLSP